MNAISYNETKNKINKTYFKTINQIKQGFRNHNSLYIDHARDNEKLLQYLYRLERLEIILVTIDNKEFNISVYMINPYKNNLIINYKY